MGKEASGKSLGHEANERLREVVRGVVASDFGGNKTAAAKRLGVSQSLVQEFLDGSRGAGVKLISAVSAYTGRPMDELLGKAPAPPVRTVERDDRYPSRPAAARAAREIGVAEDAVAAVLTWQLDADDDPGAGWWLDQMRGEADRMRRVRKGGASGDPADVSAAKAAASVPKIPRRKP